MTRKIDMETPEIVAYEFDEKLEKEDVEHVHDDLKEAISASDSVRFFADMRHLSEVEPEAILEDLKLTREYLGDIERFAVVGDKRWQSWLTGMTDKLARGEARYFDPDHLDEAEAWVRAN